MSAVADIRVQTSVVATSVIVISTVAACVSGCGRINYDSLGAAEDASPPSIDSGLIDGGAVDATATSTTPQVIDTGGFPFKIAADATNLYWAEFGEGTLHRIPLAGGPSVQLVAARSPAAVYGLTVANGFAYLCDSATGEIRSVPTVGGAAEVIATSPCFDLVADGTHLYWSSGAAGEPAIRRLALPNGPVEDVGVPGASAGNLEMFGANLYWTIYGLGEVHALSTAGGASTTLATVATGGPWGLTVDREFVYFAEHHAGDGEVSRVPVGGGPVEVLATNQGKPHQIVRDGSVLYWVNEDDGTIMRQTPGNAAVVIADGQDQPLGLVVAGDAVYWTSRGGSVSKVAK